MRTVNIEYATDLAGVLYTNGISSKEFHSAIGYLATWGGDGYTHSDIHVQNDGDMMAVFTNEHDPTRKYVIGAIWRDDTYGFHS